MKYYQVLAIFILIVFIQFVDICHGKSQGEINLWTRPKRQSYQGQGNCGIFEFECDNGQCIDKGIVCDGQPDCDDQSDETGTVCYDVFCPGYGFRCAYGACLDGTVECNGVRDCLDNSDELTIRCPGILESLRENGNCSDGYFQCRQSGECIHEDEVCNGRADCKDATDETVEKCSSSYCPSFGFRCSYGGCVPGSAKCNGVYDCHDRSDETRKLCGVAPPPVPKPTPPTRPTRPTKATPPPVNGCRIPIFENGRMYDTFNPSQEFIPGQYLMNGQAITFVCKQSTLVGSNNTFCVNGEYLNEVPKCSKFCSNLPLNTISVQASCHDPSGATIPCSEFLPPNTIAVLTCKTGYRKPDRVVQDTIYCTDDGSWSSHVFKCEQVCGVISEGYAYVVGGKETNITHVPWHAAVYELSNGKYTQICGGTILNPTAIVTAAHCFWDHGINAIKDKSLFAVAVGKTLRDYYNKEFSAQFFNISQLDVYEKYQDVEGLYVFDIAVVVLTKPIIYKPFIKPACVQFDLLNNEKYVVTGKEARVAGWGLTASGGNSSEILKVVDLETIDYHSCRRQAPESFKQFITPDKFCAGTTHGENVCQGDSGGGLLFKEVISNSTVYYLRGLVSAGPRSGSSCDSSKYTAFSDVQVNINFLYKYTIF